jgi:hypothetical protein
VAIGQNVGLAGVSSSLRRSQKLNRPIAPPNRNAMRQPYAATSSPLRKLCTERLTAAASSTPEFTQKNTMPQTSPARRGTDSTT